MKTLVLLPGSLPALSSEGLFNENYGAWKGSGEKQAHQTIRKANIPERCAKHAGTLLTATFVT